MTKNMSPKMQNLVDELAAGTKILSALEDGRIEAYEVTAEGRTWMGKMVTATAKALIERGVIVAAQVDGKSRYILVAPVVEEIETPTESEPVTTEVPITATPVTSTELLDAVRAGRIQVYTEDHLLVAVPVDAEGFPEAANRFRVDRMARPLIDQGLLVKVRMPAWGLFGYRYEAPRT